MWLCLATYVLVQSCVCLCHSLGFCGLVNQAMTCYLNSLLQSLYMTPEFRNAIYRCDRGDEWGGVGVGWGVGVWVRVLGIG